MGESKNINRPKNFYLIAKAPELVKSSLYDRPEPATKHERNDKIVKFHILYAKARIKLQSSNKDKIKLLQIKIAEDDTGKKYYFLRPVATEINNLTNSAIAKDVNNDNSSLLNSEANIIITDLQDTFNPTEQKMLNNVENWNEADHPRDEAGKFTEKGGEATKKGKPNTYKQSLLKETKSIIKDIEDEILTIVKTNEKILALENLDEWDLKAVERNLSKAEELEKQIKYYKENLAEILQMPNTVDNAKEQEMALIEELKKLITKVENDKREDMDDGKKVENEKVDKRKLIDEVGGILKGKVDEEVWRTIIGKIEKIGYNESEKGTADNEKEEDKKEVKELKEEMKEDVENQKKCNNSVDNDKKSSFDKINEIYNSAILVGCNFLHQYL